MSRTRWKPKLLTVVGWGATPSRSGFVTLKIKSCPSGHLTVSDLERGPLPTFDTVIFLGWYGHTTRSYLVMAPLVDTSEHYASESDSSVNNSVPGFPLMVFLP
jgi:hypothetical protein